MIIGISGHAGCGKDLSATFLCEGRKGYITMALADSMKRYLKEVYQFSNEQLWGPSEFRNAPDMRYPDGKGGFLTPRKALQTLGTEWGRACFEDTWVNLCIKNARKLEDPRFKYSKERGIYRAGLFESVFSPPTNAVVVTDVRFKNEIEAIKKASGVVVRVKRPGFGTEVKGGVANHTSETERASIPDTDVDVVIDNSGTVQDLQKSVSEARGRIIGIHLARRRSP